jgi:hypothetical protein
MRIKLKDIIDYPEGGGSIQPIYRPPRNFDPKHFAPSAALSPASPDPHEKTRPLSTRLRRGQAEGARPTVSQHNFTAQFQ